MKKALRIFTRILLSVFALLIVVWILIQLPPVQTYIINRIADSLEEKTGFSFDIASVDIRFPAETVFRGVSAIDQNGDTLLAGNEISLSGIHLNTNFEALDLRSLKLIEPTFKLIQLKGDSLTNLDHLLNNFASSESTDTSLFSLSLSAVDLRNGHFVYHDNNYEAIDTLIDFNHLDISNLYINAKHLSQSGDYMLATIDRLGFKEQTGFELSNLTGQFELRPDTMMVSGMNLKTPGTHLIGDLSFIAPWSSYSEFTREVVMRHQFERSVLDFKDLWYFSTDLYGLNRKVEFEGRVRGPVANLKARDLFVKLDDNTWFKGKIDLAGLPWIDETFIDFTIDDLRANKAELDRIPLYPFDSNELLQTPENFKQLGNIGFKGKFTGFLTDFVSFGTITTAIGSVSTDIKLQELNEVYTYSGSLRTDKFNLGKFYSAPELGSLTCSFDVKGEGLTRSDLDIEVDGIISDIAVQGYRYTDITAAGTFKKNFFNGDLAINDDNAQLWFKGLIDFSGKVPSVDFKTQITHLNFGAINLADLRGYTSLSGDFNIKGKGSNLNNINGDIVGDGVLFCTIDREFPIEHFELHMNQTKEGKSFILNSNVASGKLEGKFDFDGLDHSFRSILADVIPTIEKEKNFKGKENFTIELDVHTFELVSEIFIPELYLADNSYLALQMNDETSALKGIFQSDRVTYLDFAMDTMIVDVTRPDKELYLSVLADRVSYGSTALESFSLDVRNESEVLFANLGWGDPTDLIQGEIIAQTTILSNTEINTKLTQATLIFDDAPWQLADTAIINVANKGVHIEDFFLSHKTESILIFGDISTDPSLPLSAELKNVDLKGLDPILESSGIKMGGLVTGNLTAKDLYNKTTVTCDITAIKYTLNDYLIGDICTESSWDNKERRLIIGGEIDRINEKTLVFGGYYNPEDTESPIDLHCELEHLPLEFINGFIEEGISDISGNISGRVNITGTIDSPQLKGKADFEDASLHVDYLNTTYHLKQSCGIYPDMFTIDRVRTEDEEGNIAYLIGTIQHDNFGDWNFDVYLDMEDQPFLVMNTTEDDNSMYFGKAYATGYVSVFGTEYDLGIDVNVKTEKGTVISLPLGGSEEVYFADFISFVDHNAPEDEEEPLDLSGINMNLELDITPDAQFKIVFDEAVGDEMRGRGKGHLNMVISNLSTFNMFGDIEVLQGRYLFTLKNLINKEFDLEPGGRISWYGDPFDADINLRTAYRLNTSVYELMPEGSGDQYKQRIPVNLFMDLSGKLFNPNIGFNINLPSADELTKARVASAINTEQEMNRQAFALLVLRRFLTPPDIARTTSSLGLAENPTELLSSQISNWLSQISEDFDIGVNYAPGDEISNDELAVALSTQLFNERLLLSGNFGVAHARSAASGEDPNSLIGDIKMELKISEDGRLRVIVYNQSNQYDLLNTQQSPYTQGLSIVYQEEFDNLYELFKLKKPTE